MAKKINVFIIVFIMVSVCFKISHAEIIDRIVAIVNEEIITFVELNTALKPYFIELEKTNYPSEKKNKIIDKLQKDMLEKMIESKLTEQEAKRLNIQVSDEELQASIDRILKKEDITKEELIESLLKEKITYEEYESDMRRQILQPKLINRVIKANVVITDEEIKEYYDEHEAQYAGSKKYYLRNILAPGQEEIEKAKQLLDLGQSFEETARLYSMAPNASSGGDLGSFELDVFAEKIRENILLLEKNQYTDVILTDGGFQIFYLENIELSVGKTLKEANDEIVGKLFAAKAEKKYIEWFKVLKERSHLKIIL
ncbi:MAG: SurA N-terminal domain-containing protein [Desulfobacterales bacterium]|nr:SurA N-terminal domain-containing protein [Desulfobacterales bacterium]